MKILWSDNASSAPTPLAPRRSSTRLRLMQAAAAGTAVAVLLSAGSLALAPSGELDRLLAATAQAFHSAPATAEERVESVEAPTDTSTIEDVAAVEPEEAPPAQPAAAAAQPTVEKATRLAGSRPVSESRAEEEAPSAFDAARWGAAASAADVQAARQIANVFAQAPEAHEVTAETAFAPLFGTRQQPAPSPTHTGSIPRAAAVDPAEVPVAETEAEAAALEQRLFVEGEAVPATGRLATADRHVNMRATADNDATILAVVPQNGTVELLDHCPNWCQVEYRGQRGYVFGSFLRRDGSEQAAAN